jgi:hypothetical protein
MDIRDAFLKIEVAFFLCMFAALLSAIVVVMPGPVTELRFYTFLLLYVLGCIGIFITLWMSRQLADDVADTMKLLGIDENTVRARLAKNAHELKSAARREWGLSTTEYTAAMKRAEDAYLADRALLQRMRMLSDDPTFTEACRAHEQNTQTT